MHSEQGDYGRSWFTQGMIEAGKAGNPKAFPLLRGMYDWFDNPDLNPYQPYLCSYTCSPPTTTRSTRPHHISRTYFYERLLAVADDGIGNGEQGQIASTRMYLETPVGVWSDMQVAQDIYRDNIWMSQLIARDSLGISKYHMPTPNHPHCYEITSFLSMFDHYRATGNTSKYTFNPHHNLISREVSDLLLVIAAWLNAAEGAWDIITSDFLHIDGSSALTEGAPDQGTDWKKKTYRIQPGTGTGETCCTTFWIKFNQRFSLLKPTEEKYAAEIETAVYNALLKNIVKRPASEKEAADLASVSRVETSGRGTRMQRAAALTSQLEADDATLSGSASPPVCTKSCRMAAYAKNEYYTGEFAPGAATDLAGCVALCLKQPDCVAMTFSVRPAAPCELYKTITTTKMESTDTQGAVKCAAGSQPAASCGHFSPAPAPGPPSILPPGIRYHGTMEGLQERPQNVNTCCEGQGTRVFGSLPEYIYSLANPPGSGFFVNMFADSTLSYNATVVSGSGGSPAPPALSPTPPPAGVVPGPAPPLTWELVAKDGFFPGDKHPSTQNVHDLEACKKLCEGSTGADDNQMCMAVAFSGPPVGPPPPPPPAACTSDCIMVQVKGGYHSGTFNETQTSSIKTLDACKAACLKDEACVELTFVNRKIDPCVLYQSIYADIVAGAVGWVKCAAGSTDPKCAPITPGQPQKVTNCFFYQALDMSHQVMVKGATKQSGTDNWMLHGRRVTVQHDYPTTGAAVSAADTASAGAMITPVKFAMSTRFPYDNAVRIKVSWALASVTAVSAPLKLRVPSWLQAPLANITINGVASTAGQPGSFLTLNQQWKQGDEVAFTLPTMYKLSAYTGSDQVKGYEGKRFALSVGPIVLGCVGNMSAATNAPILPVSPDAKAAEEWLVPVAGAPLNFHIKGAPGMTFMPMWEMGSADRFTTYPIFSA